mmetsp:Transcript_102918/g.266046  ORF Transcript_102918/g.266046 Transcript_102918/m.266046 type:complete len:259 (+) Transcript_102918:99-875(+)
MGDAGRGGRRAASGAARQAIQPVNLRGEGIWIWGRGMGTLSAARAHAGVSTCWQSPTAAQRCKYVNQPNSATTAFQSTEPSWIRGPVLPSLPAAPVSFALPRRRFLLPFDSAPSAVSSAVELTSRWRARLAAPRFAEASSPASSASSAPSLATTISPRMSSSSKGMEQPRPERGCFMASASTCWPTSSAVASSAPPAPLEEAAEASTAALSSAAGPSSNASGASPEEAAAAGALRDDEELLVSSGGGVKYGMRPRCQS